LLRRPGTSRRPMLMRFSRLCAKSTYLGCLGP
jgi:hypothetical protein